MERTPLLAISRYLAITCYGNWSDLCNFSTHLNPTYLVVGYMKIRRISRLLGPGTDSNKYLTKSRFFHSNHHNNPPTNHRLTYIHSKDQSGAPLACLAAALTSNCPPFVHLVKPISVWNLPQGSLHPSDFVQLRNDPRQR